MSPRTVPIGSIAIGERDRADLGDITALADSIKSVGLLHPIVTTEALVLVAGGRRLAALRSLGWTEVPVTVVDLTNVESILRAEMDENTARKSLTPHEAMLAWKRRSRVLAEVAAKRRAHGTTAPGRSKSATDQPALVEAPTASPANACANLAQALPAGEKVSKIAALPTGYSRATLQKVETIDTVANEGVASVGRGKERRKEPVPEPVREVAKRALEEVKQTGAAVDRAHRAVAEAMDKFLPPDPDAPHRKWRQEFLSVLGGARKPMRFTPEDIVQRADDECLDELRRLVEDMANHYSRVRKLAERSTPDNVRKLRAV